MKMGKYSRQRELIEKAVNEHRNHLSADDVYGLLKPENPNLSLGTVYRNLNTLVTQGVIKKVQIPGGCDRFDGETYEHYHVICRDCGQVFDLKIEIPNEINEEIYEQTGVVVTGYQLIIEGICQGCRAEDG